MQPRNLFAMPKEGTDKVGEIDLNSVLVGVEDMNLEQQNKDVTTWSRSGLDGVHVDACVIEQALATAMPKPNHIPHDLFDEDENLDDTYIADGFVPPYITPGEDSDDDFFFVKFAQGRSELVCIYLIFFCRPLVFRNNELVLIEVYLSLNITI
jgi:hypothetical protein